MAHKRALRVVKNPAVGKKAKRMHKKSRKNPEAASTTSGFGNLKIGEIGNLWRSFKPSSPLQERRKLWHQEYGTPMKAEKKAPAKKATKVKAEKKAPAASKKAAAPKKAKKMTREEALVKARKVKAVNQREINKIVGKAIERYAIVAPKNVPIQIKSKKRKAKKVDKKERTEKKKKNPSVSEFFGSFVPEFNMESGLPYAGGFVAGAGLSVGAGMLINSYGDTFGQYKDWVRCAAQAGVSGILGFASFNTDGKIKSALKGATIASTLVTVVDLGVTAVRTFVDGGLSAIRIPIAKSLLPAFKETEPVSGYYIERPPLMMGSIDDFTTTGVKGFDVVIAALKSSIGLGEVVFEGVKPHDDS